MYRHEDALEHDAIADPVLEALADLSEQIDGDIRIDALHRMLYATDASLYASEPLAVAFPKHRADVVAIVQVAERMGIPLVPRTAGTSLSGQTVGNGALVVDVSRYMNRILEIDPERMQVRVQPGVILDELNRALAEHGLFFGPDTSTSNRCMIGGMIGNNSCGSHSILYGNTLAHVREIEAVLTDGSVVRLGDQTPAEVEAMAAERSRAGAITRTLLEMVDRHRDEILERFPKPEVVRRNMGYPLDFLARSARYEADGHPWNLGRFLCGTEGTLAFTTEATLDLVLEPRHAMIVAVHFDDLMASLEATVAAVEHDPSAVELMDKRILDATLDNLEQARNRDWVVGDPAAVLAIEFYRESPEALAEAAEALIARFEAEGRGYAWVPLHPPDTKRVWDLRKAGLGLLFGKRGDVKAVTFVEDTAVAVADLPAYIERFTEIMERHGTQCVYYAHASVGELHLRPELNPKDPADIERMIAIATEVADLVREFRGTISGEHGDGRIRSPFIERMLGPTVTGLLADTKRAWDPRGIMNPRNIVDPRPIDEELRYPPGTPPLEIDTHFAFAEDPGLLRHVERCNGAGVCRKLHTAGGTMCPSYMVTREEVHTTRGRANAFRMLLMGDRPQEAMHSHELYEALDLCLACKGCKSECPASVDMARLKSEFLQHYWDEHGMPLRVRLMGQPEQGYKFAQRLAGLSNRGARSWLGKEALKRVMGVHPWRDMPEFAKRTFRQQLARREPLPPAAGERGHAGEVVFVVDVFTDYNDPHIGIAAIEVLELAGYDVIVPELEPLGRPQLSKGLVREAKGLAERNVERLAPFAERGLPMVGVEPSEILTLGDEYPELVPGRLRPIAARIGALASMVDVFVGRELAAGHIALPWASEAPRDVLVHGHCHQKALIGEEPVLDALRQIPGANVRAIRSGCCGMAGSFGYELEHYEVSMQIGELVLFPAVREAAKDTLLVAPGTSCRHQIWDGTRRTALHPIEAIRQACE